MICRRNTNQSANLVSFVITEKTFPIGRKLWGIYLLLAAIRDNIFSFVLIEKQMCEKIIVKCTDHQELLLQS